MVKKLLALLCSFVLVFSLATVVMAQADQEKPKKAATPKLERWDGSVTLISKDKSTFTVRKIGGDATKTVAWDNTTEFQSQEHGSKKVNTITAADIKEGDRVICQGIMSKDGVLHATRISKRLTPLPVR